MVQAKATPIDHRCVAFRSSFVLLFSLYDVMLKLITVLLLLWSCFPTFCLNSLLNAVFSYFNNSSFKALNLISYLNTVTMALSPGTIIKSTKALNDSYFENTTILLTEVDNNGAIGFVVNKPFSRKLNDLQEFNHAPNFPLYEGGPVDQLHLFFIHQQFAGIEHGISLGNGICYGGNFKQAVTGISHKQITSKDLKIFVGYCGWDLGELEAEIEEGSWTIEELDLEFLFA